MQIKIHTLLPHQFHVMEQGRTGVIFMKEAGSKLKGIWDKMYEKFATSIKKRNKRRQGTIITVLNHSTISLFYSMFFVRFTRRRRGLSS